MLSCCCWPEEQSWSRRGLPRNGPNASTGGSAVGARSVEGQASVSTGGSAVSARSVEGQASVSTGGSAVSARSVEGQASVSTGGSAVSARSVEGAASVSTGGGAVSARSVEGQASVSTGGCAVSARSVEGQHLSARAAAQSVQGVWRSSICQHGRQRSQCKECGGASICQHGRQRSECKECGGASICQHGRQRSQCKECGGAASVSTGGSAVSARSVEEQHLSARAAAQSVQGVWRGKHLSARAAAQSVQGVWRGKHLPAWAGRSRCKECASAYIGRTVAKQTVGHGVCEGTVVSFTTRWKQIQYPVHRWYDCSTHQNSTQETIITATSCWYNSCNSCSSTSDRENSSGDGIPTATEADTEAPPEDGTAVATTTPAAAALDEAAATDGTVTKAGVQHQRKRPNRSHTMHENGL